MSIRRKGLQASGLLAVCEVVNQGAGFVRNMILARLLTKADFGVAAALAMIIMLLEFSAKLGIARFVIQCKEGDRAEFIASAHLMQCLAGIVSAVLLLAAAGPLALLFGLSEQRSALYFLALIPLFRGLEHLDVRRFERDLRFRASAMVEMIPQLVITLAAWPVARWLGDYRAVLILLIAKTALTSAGSHILAERPYRWRFDRECIFRILRFGWPLLVNGFLMFGVMHGDQFLVATFYTMVDLAPYAAAMTLTLAPTFFFGRVFSSVMLPVMSKSQEDSVAFERRYRFIIAILCAFSAAYVSGLVIGAEALMQFVFGKKYSGSGILLAWLSVVNAFRNVRIASTIAAMAKGDSENQMISNFWRMSGLLPALAVAAAEKPVWMIAAAGLVGEILACSASFRRLTRRDGIPLNASVVPTFLVALAVVAAGAATWLLGLHETYPLVALGFATIAGLVAGGLVAFGLEDSRREVLLLWSSRRLMKRFRPGTEPATPGSTNK